ncbi:MAG: type II secretion system protein [Planctomycetaceae bacterium]|nr:type II secretion system protein [Planctomycetaceae bacterium]
MRQDAKKRSLHRTFPYQVAGFTLLEVTVSLAVSTMILIALIGVMRSVGGQLRSLKEQKSERLGLIQQILQQDALTTSMISRKADSYVLVGSFVSPDLTESYHELVIYECNTWLDGSLVLVRRTNKQQEVVAKGIRQIVIERLDSQGVPQPISNLPIPFPSRAKVWLWTDDRDAAPLMFDVSAH